MTGTLPDPPHGYDRSYIVEIDHPGCLLTVGMDKRAGAVHRFLVQLQHRLESDRWTDIARIDHNGTDPSGHDVYREGLHVDIDRHERPELTVELAHAPLPPNRGVVVRGCVEYLAGEARYFVDVFEGNSSPKDRPRWSPDGGESSPDFLNEQDVRRRMSEDPILTPEELTARLAADSELSSAEIERRAKAMEIAPVEDGTVVES